MTDSERRDRDGRDRSEGGGREPEWRRRRRLAEVFGDTLPETTGDERDESTSRGGERADEAWLRAQVPPHHGGT